MKRCHILPSILLSLLSLTPLLPATAQMISFAPTGGPSGGVVTSVEQDASGRLYAGTVGGLYQSNDNGRTWHLNKSMLGPIRFIERDSSGLIYVGLDFSVVRTSNGGASWEGFVENGFMMRGMAFHQNGTIFLAGNTPAAETPVLVRSVNGGTSWEPLQPANELPDSLRFTAGNYPLLAAGDQDVIYYGLGGEVMKSTDNGTSWCPIHTVEYRDQGDVPYRDTLLYAMTILSGDTLLVSDMNGLYRHGSCGDTAIADTSVGAIVRAFARENQNTYFGGSEGRGVWRTEDRGMSWVRYTRVIPIVHDFTILPDQTVVAGMNANGIFRYDVDVADWDFSGEGIHGLQITGFGEDWGGNLYALSRTSLFRSTDRGGTWETADEVGLNNHVVTGFQVSPDNGHLYASTSGGGDNFLMQSIDSGVTWRFMKAPHLSNPGYSALYVDSNWIWAGTDNQYSYYSGVGRLEKAALRRYSLTDGLWEDVIRSLQVTSFAALPGGGLFATTKNTSYTTGRGLMVTHDNGATWDSVRSLNAGEIVEISSTSKGDLFARNSDGELYRSEDGGDSWIEVATDLPQVTHQPVMNDSGVFFYASYGTLYRSIDRGESWSPAATDLPINLYSVGFDRDNFVYLGGDYLPVYRSVRSLSVESKHDARAALSIRSVSPNPVHSGEPVVITVVPSSESRELTIELHDLLGRPLAPPIQISVAPYTSTCTLSLPELPSGPALLRSGSEGRGRMILVVK